MRGGHVTPTLDVAAAQHALDALITGDRDAAAARFTRDVVVTGVGGCLSGRTTGLDAVLDRFADISRLTHGTFGTEVEAVYGGSAAQLVVVTRHWASVDGKPVHATQAFLVTVDAGRVGAVDALSRPGSATGIWD
jgi:ketosteroid isomerase-like protein